MSFATQALIAAHQASLGVQGELLTIRRGDQVLLTDIAALPGKSSAETFDGMGLATTVELQDWILQASLLRVDDQPLTLERGDILELTAEGVNLRFAVHHPNGNQPPFRPCDARGVLLRIHSVTIAPPPAEDDPPDGEGE